MKQSTQRSDAAHGIGYGRPPKATRFRKGRSGNPKGRPSGDENLLSVFKRMVTKRIKIKEGDKSRTITMADAIISAELQGRLAERPDGDEQHHPPRRRVWRIDRSH